MKVLTSHGGWLIYTIHYYLIGTGLTVDYQTNDLSVNQTNKFGYG